MKFTCAIDINAVIKTIQNTFFNTEDIKHYQDGF